MGKYRFILSIMVLISHTGMSFFGYNQGVVSVISFLLISGFTMEMLMEKYYTKKVLIKYFYIDRILRLYPQFIFYLIVTLMLNYIFPINESINSFIKDVNLVNIIKNILLIPLGYYMFDGLTNCQIIPSVWTLGLELSFYIVFPLIYFKNKKISSSVVSILVFMMAYIGMINSDWFDYRLLPGNLFIFLTGSIIRSSKYQKEKIKSYFYGYL